MELKKAYVKYFLAFKILGILIGTIIMFYALFFNDENTFVENIIKNRSNPMMYICLFFSFLGSYVIVASILKRENPVKK